MKISNPIQMNDWEIKKFLLVILSFQLAFWGSIWLDLIGLYIPFLRQLIGLIYLTFVPGILILRILKLHNLDNLKVILYTIGLSLSTLMFAGFFINTIFYHYGISSPISLLPLVCTISIIIGILTIFAYIRDRSFSSHSYVSLKEILTPPMMVLSFIPFIAILGTYLLNFYGNNLLLMILLPFIALVPIIIVFTKFITEKYYAYSVFALGIALLYHRSLISLYIWGWDIQVEYYVINNVIQNSIWDFTIYGNLNAMLSLVILGPIYSIILNMSLDGVFKIIYPFLFAFVPLGIYVILREQGYKKIAFLACFFFISIFTFYTEMLQVARQEIAEIFLVLIILSMIDRDLDKFSKTVFFMIFSASLIVSHYGLSYLFLLMLLLSWTIATIGYQISSRQYMDDFFISYKGKAYIINLKKYSFRANLFSFISVLWFCFFTLAWYIYLAGASPFNSIVDIAHRIIITISSEILNPESVQGITLLTTSALTPFHEVVKYLNIVTIIFIVIGFMISVLWYKREHFDIRYLLLSFGALCICIFGVTMPYFASALNTSRIYQISLILLAPFCIKGGISIFRLITGVINKTWTNHGVKNSMQILSVFFAIFLLFNSGWVDEIAKENQGALLNNTIDYPKFNELEVIGVKWLTKVNDDKLIYADENRRYLLYRFLPLQKILSLPKDPNQIAEQSYVYFGNFNIINQSVMSQYKYREISIIPINIFTTGSRIYDDGSAEVYFNK